MSKNKKVILDPKNDYVFKRIFGWVGNEKITGDLISSIIGEEVNDVDLDGNKILERDLIDEKLGELDVHAKRFLFLTPFLLHIRPYLFFLTLLSHSLYFHLLFLSYSFPLDFL